MPIQYIIGICTIYGASTQMKILILQHIEVEDPGHIKTLMEADRWELVTIELDRNDAIPDNLDRFDAMFCMGGPMDTWMEYEYPWLAAEKAAIKTFVLTLEKPFLGFCLGAQLLGEVLGGQVVSSAPPEIGVLDVQLRPAGADDPLFRGWPATLKTLQWHSYEVQGLDSQPQVSILASSPTTAYQAFRYKHHAYGIQFHVEAKADTVDAWGQVPAYREALHAAWGAHALPELARQAQQHIGSMNKHCAIMYKNFKQLLEVYADGG